MYKYLKSFQKDDSGAVTVDWVILGAAIVGLGLASAASVRQGTHDLGNDTRLALSGVEVASLGDLGSVPSTWEFTGFFVSREWIEGPGGLIDQINNWGSSPEQLQRSYDSYARGMQRYLDQGNTRIAGLMVDHMYAVEQILIAEGVGVSPDSVSVQQGSNLVSNAMAQG